MKADIPVTVTAAGLLRGRPSSRARCLVAARSLLRLTCSSCRLTLGCGSFATGVSMDAVRRHLLLSLWTLSLVPPVWFVPAPYPPLQPGDAAADLMSPAPPGERLPSRATWVDRLSRSLVTYFPSKYPGDNFVPYVEELGRLRDAVSRGDHWGAKREMGVFLKMVTDRAYGLGDEAAMELIGMAQRVMPEEEFGIVFPKRAGCGAESLSCP